MLDFDCLTIKQCISVDTPFYADETCIRVQRIIAVAACALSYWKAGSYLLGASLLQQVIGNATGCEKAKPERVAAAILFVTATPVSCALGLLFWAFSLEANQSI